MRLPLLPPASTSFLRPAQGRIVEVLGFIGEPRVTYTTPGIDADIRKTFRHAIDESLGRCTPMPFSKGMGGAIAGRPIAIRYVDKRSREEREHHP